VFVVQLVVAGRGLSLAGWQSVLAASLVGGCLWGLVPGGLLMGAND